MAARASYELGEPDKMREYLGLAEASDSEAGIAVELTQAELKLRGGQYEQALATLVRARRNAGRHPEVLRLLAAAYRGLRDWDSLAGSPGHAQCAGLCLAIVTDRRYRHLQNAAGTGRIVNDTG